jgi:DNA-directed RNA polymerase specialized sigma24 family protein
MARNKLASEARKQHRRKRDNRRVAGDEVAMEAAPAAEASPSRVAAGRDLLNAVRQRLTAEERVLAELRGQGHTWEEIAQRVGGNAQARRVQLARALDRVARDLDIDGGADE